MSIAKQFHDLYYKSMVWQGSTTWLGIAVGKCPLDLWIFQEIIFEVQPDTIIECGTGNGGSTLFMALICDMVGKGKVISIDISGSPNRPQHDRITYLVSSSTAPFTIDSVKRLASGVILVDLDSAHDMAHVLEELRYYSPLVTPGSYIIVEDTNIGHDILPGHGPGPREAVEVFLKENSEFVVDISREKLLLTFNPGGYLRKVA